MILKYLQAWDKGSTCLIFPVLPRSKHLTCLGNTCSHALNGRRIAKLRRDAVLVEALRIIALFIHSYPRNPQTVRHLGNLISKSTPSHFLWTTTIYLIYVGDLKPETWAFLKNSSEFRRRFVRFNDLHKSASHIMSINNINVEPH